MKIVETFEEAVALGAEVIIRDAENVYRCYMPGEIQRQVAVVDPDAPIAASQ